MSAPTTELLLKNRSASPPPIPRIDKRRELLARVGFWVGGVLCCGPVFGFIVAIGGMFSTTGTLGEGEDVAANAAKITGGIALSINATLIGFGAAAVGAVILVPSVLALSRMKKERKAANQALQTTPVTRSGI